MRAPLVTLITAAEVMPEADLFARLAALAALPPALRGRFAVQLRDPQLPASALHALGRRLREATAALGAPLFVNDRLDLAVLLGAEGVHLGGRSVSIEDARAFLGPDAFVSVACHSPGDVARAAAAGADAALLSPIFATPGKGRPIGLTALREARRLLIAAGSTAALIALGGVDAPSAPACLAAGADGVAAIRADPAAVLARLSGGESTQRREDAKTQKDKS
jgi:thiamine-phosphate pyrophosphorylase